MSRERLEKLRHTHAEFQRQQGKVPDSRAIEKHTERVAEKSERRWRDKQGKPKLATPPPPNMVRIIDKNGNSHVMTEKAFKTPNLTEI